MIALHLTAPPSRLKQPPEPGPSPLHLSRRRSTRTAGYTLLELVVVAAIIGVLFGIVILNVKGLQNNANTAHSVVASSLLQGRTTAISTTSAVRVTLTSPTVLLFETSRTCNNLTGWTTLSSPAPTFATGVRIAPSATLGSPWRVCFTSRGELSAPAPAALNITDTESHSRSLSVYLTGSVSQ